MISKFWVVLGAITYMAFLSVLPIVEVGANGVARPVWEQNVGTARLVMLTSPFPPSTGSLHIALELDSSQGNPVMVNRDTPIVLTISPGEGVYQLDSEAKVEELILYRGALDQYHANVFIDRAGDWIFTVDVLLEGEEYRVSKEVKLVKAQIPKVPLLTTSFVVLLFGGAYLAWWMRIHRKAGGS